MNIRTPYYYSQFRCIADQCTDTCCAGWDVDVDKVSTEYYKSVTGTFGDRIKSVTVMHEDGESHFKLKSNGWCPFLNEHLLCDLYTELGEDKLCETCANFPRFIEEYGSTREIGLAFSCITAGELMLKDDTPVTFVNNEDGKPVTNYNDIDPDVFFFLQRHRKNAYDITRNRNISIDERYALVLDMAHLLNINLKKKKYTDVVPKQARLTRGKRYELMSTYLDIFDNLEIINDNWKTLISDALEYLHKAVDEDEYYKSYEAFGKYYKDNVYEYEHLLMYYLYRYFLKAVNDGDVLTKVKFAVVGYLMIREFDVARWIKNGSFTKAEQVDIYHLYSREVEHSYENFDVLSKRFATEEIFSYETLKDMIIL